MGACACGARPALPELLGAHLPADLAALVGEYARAEPRESCRLEFDEACRVHTAVYGTIERQPDSPRRVRALALWRLAWVCANSDVDEVDLPGLVEMEPPRFAAWKSGSAPRHADTECVLRALERWRQ